MNLDENQLFRITSDASEKYNVIKQYPQIAIELEKFVNKYDTIQPKRLLPNFNEGQDSFKAPKEWKVPD
jgi:hypothetical protein